MFETANYIEAALWAVIGVGFLVVSMRRGGRRRITALAAITFLLFGGSDVVEVQTGAWWRPWWLFVWKAACVLSMAYLLFLWRRSRKPLCAGCGSELPGNEYGVCPECATEVKKT